MKIVHPGIVLAVGTLIGSTAWGIIPEKYQTIPDRNAFGLNPPAPAASEASAATPPVDVKLTGFAVIAGEKRAYFTIPPKDAKSVQQYLNLGEGQRDGSLEVVSISQTEGEVRVRNSGIESLLSLKNNGLQSGKGSPGMPAVPPVVNVGASPISSVNPVASAIYNPNVGSAAVAGSIPNNPAPMASLSGQNNGFVPTRSLGNQGFSSGSPHMGTVYNPVIAGTPPPQASNPEAAPAIDPRRQLEEMRRHKETADRLGGLPVQVAVPAPNNHPSIVNTQRPRTETRIVPMPPLPL